MNAKQLSRLGGFQGDVAILIVDSIPADARPSSNRIVAYGEATGHHHVVEGNVICYETPTVWYYQVAPEAPAVIRHIGEEHAPIEIAPGLIFMVPKLSQVEYDGENERRVMD